MLEISPMGTKIVFGMILFFLIFSVAATKSLFISAEIEYPLLVSISPEGLPGDDGSYNPVISDNGKFVVFQSIANDFVENDYNNRMDIFVRDIENGLTKLASVGISGKGGALGHSANPSISADGRFIAFESEASNLIPNDNNGLVDIFVYDQETGKTKIVSMSNTGEQTNDISYDPSISSDGRYVVFLSDATNLDNKPGDVFVHDIVEGKTYGLGIDGYCYFCNSFISGDGRFVTVGSIHSLTGEETSTEGDIFVYDRESGEILMISVKTDGIQMNQESEVPSITSDGRFVSFGSLASNLVDNDENGEELSLFVHDLKDGTTELLSINEKGEQMTPKSSLVPMSGDGRYVAFSAEDNIYVRDREAGTTTSLGISGKISSIAEDGSFVAIYTDEKLVDADVNNKFDVYLVGISPVESKSELVEEKTFEIPEWIKNNAGWWAGGQIEDSEFVTAIQWLITNGIMIIPETSSTTTAEDQGIPEWIKNNAGWWAGGQIEDSEFVTAIQWLITNGIMTV